MVDHDDGVGIAEASSWRRIGVVVLMNCKTQLFLFLALRFHPGQNRLFGRSVRAPRKTILHLSAEKSLSAVDEDRRAGNVSRCIAQ